MGLLPCFPNRIRSGWVLRTEWGGVFDCTNPRTFSREPRTQLSCCSVLSCHVVPYAVVMLFRTRDSFSQDKTNPNLPPPSPNLITSDNNFENFFREHDKVISIPRTRSVVWVISIPRAQASSQVVHRHRGSAEGLRRHAVRRKKQGRSSASCRLPPVERGYGDAPGASSDVPTRSATGD